MYQSPTRHGLEANRAYGREVENGEWALISTLLLLPLVLLLIIAVVFA